MDVELQPDRRAPSHPRDADEEDLGELPPLDGAEDDATEAPQEDLEDVSPEQQGDPFDDTTGEADPVEELEPDGDGKEAGWLEDAADAEELDVGPHELDDDEGGGLLDDADEPGVGDEDFGLDAAQDVLAVDGGEEGPDAEDEELREEDLPRLDADEDGELEDDDFADPWPEGAEDERPPWADRAWERAPSVPRIGMARSVVTEPDGAIVAGASLLRVTPAGALPLDMRGVHGGAIVGVARVSGRIVAATERGVFVEAGPADGRAGSEKEEGFREAAGWQALVSGAPAELAASKERMWLRTRAGGLVTSGDRGTTWEVLAASGVQAIALTPEGELVSLENGHLRRGPARAAWGTPTPPLPPGSATLVRARGDAVVVGAFGGGVFRASAGGAWERLEGTASVTALALLDDTGTALVALHSAAQDRAWIARVGADNTARIVAEIGGDADEGSPAILDLAWSDAARIAWAVGPFGVAALRPL